MRPQRQEKYLMVRYKVESNMSNLVLRGYLAGLFILDLAYFFAVPKLTEDIRMVFDTEVRGLNEALWYPNFIILVVESIIVMVGPNTHMVDLDVGEMF